jgi:hypothetical protein
MKGVGSIRVAATQRLKFVAKNFRFADFRELADKGPRLQSALSRHSKVAGRHEIRLAKVETTRDRSSHDAGGGCRCSRRSSTRGI